MDQTPLKQVRTNNARDSKGWAFGLEGDQFLPVVIVGMTSLGLGTILMLTRVLGVLQSFVFIIVPPALVYLYFALFRKNKPAHTDIDFLIGLLMSEEWGRGDKQPVHPYLQDIQGETDEVEAVIAISQQGS
jgi:hypothetical protein